MRNLAFALLLALTSLAAPAGAEDPPPKTAEQAPAEVDADQKSLTEINKKLTNPVSDLWSITFQQNNFRLDPGQGHGQRWSSNLLFQPVLPVAISEDWNLITRPVIPLFVSQPHPDTNDLSDVDRTTAFGDITFLQMVSPSPHLAGGWLLGIGPTWIFPSATSDWTGSGKWQVGPGAIVGYLAEKWIVGAFVQNWLSFSGSNSRRDTNSMNLQPIASYFLPGGWSIGYSGNILADWKANASNTFTVPIGVQVAKVHKLGELPVRFGLGLQWMPEQPDRYGQKWNVQVVVAPVLPKLIKGNLVDPSHMSFGLGR